MTKKTSDAQLRAGAKYDAANTRGIYLKLNLTTDARILDWLDEIARKDPVRGKQGYIKGLILADMQSKGVYTPEGK